MDINSKPAYQPWNEDEFSGDLLVSSMTPVQRWMYRTLLQKAFFHKTRPDLPADDTILWMLAGCESIDQWNQNKSVVLNMFQIDERDGEQVYIQKRLRQDWERLTQKRENMSDAGKRGAANRWNEPTTVQRGLPYRRLIPEACRKILGIRAEKEDYYKKDLKELAETYGGTELVTAFEEWAKNLTSTPKYPVRDFIKVADGYLQNKVLPEHLELESLCMALYGIGGQTFTGKYRQLLNNLATEFSLSEIERAYGTFVTGKDAYEMKFVVRDFCEGAGKTIILSNKKRESETERLHIQMNNMAERAQKAVIEELENSEEIEESL